MNILFIFVSLSNQILVLPYGKVTRRKYSDVSLRSSIQNVI